MVTQNKSKRYTLSRKLIYLSILGFCIAGIVFLLLSRVFTLLVQDYLTFSSYIRDREMVYLGQLQNYVLEEKISATDSDRIRLWAEENQVPILTISREHVLLFDNTYVGDAPLKDADSIQLRDIWRYSDTIKFHDGPANVYLFKSFGSNLYTMASGLAMFLAAASWILTFLSGIRREIRYILLLQREVNEMSNGHLQDGFTLQGNDELTDLAATLDQMYHRIQDDAQRETRRIKEQEDLVLGLAHDLRTPLTGLYGYLEVIKRIEGLPIQATDYLNKAFGKADQIKDMANQLFECFIASNKEPCELEPPGTAEYHLGDYLSEFCLQLDLAGYRTDIAGLSWDTYVIRINLDFIHRILNNILSNIEKYANPAYPVLLSSKYERGYFGICIHNHIKKQDPVIKGTRIGVSNITQMMNKMRGEIEVIKTRNTYEITLWFPIILQ